jgi:hypothetical protein
MEIFLPCPHVGDKDHFGTGRYFCVERTYLSIDDCIGNLGRFGSQ